jgi:hypothetical protein
MRRASKASTSLAATTPFDDASLDMFNIAPGAKDLDRKVGTRGASISNVR